TFNSAQLTTGGDATVQVTAAATQATVNGSVTYATAATTVGAGSISINGVTFTTTANDTVQTLLNSINASESSTGVHASYDSTAKKIV
ncbi:flagellin hook IN motif-containing protein, partial [Streptomyces scabiei]